MPYLFSVLAVLLVLASPSVFAQTAEDSVNDFTFSVMQRAATECAKRVAPKLVPGLNAVSTANDLVSIMQKINEILGEDRGRCPNYHYVGPSGNDLYLPHDNASGGGASR